MLKKQTFWPLILLILPGLVASIPSRAADQPVVDLKNCPPRLTRAQSFVGIHLDFHAGADCTKIGENVTEQMVETLIDKVKPDFIQIDCKGHAGYSSYPTKVGNPAPGFVKDALKIWREVTARRGVALYMHYSGVWDNQAVTKHPEWAAVNDKGQIDKDKTSVFGPYVDQLLIPQLKELRQIYQVDGMWIDGECWATVEDYSKMAQAAFQAKTGLTELPKKPEDPHYPEFIEFCRDGFRQYVNHYVTELHKFDPGFQIASNWAYTSLMPEPVTINVDFISGDYSWDKSFDEARFQARCIRLQGKPWDLMAWGFRNSEKFGFNIKTSQQLKQEAAPVISLGGGFQVYFTQNRDASINLWYMDVMAPVAEFCRQRQQFCQAAVSVPQVGLLYSTAAIYRNYNRLFSFWREKDPLRGVLNALLDNQQSVDIVMEHHLKGKMNRYPLIVIPEWNYLEEPFKAELLEYVQNGGNLLLIGPETAALFKDSLGVQFTGDPAKKTVFLEHDGILCRLHEVLTRPVTVAAPVEAVGKLYADKTFDSASQPAASIVSLGKGHIGAIYANLGMSYYGTHNSPVRDFVGRMVRRLFPDPMVTITGSHCVDVVVNRLKGKPAVHLINTAGPHADTDVQLFDEIPPIGPLRVKIKLDKAPQKIVLQPAGTTLKHTYDPKTACAELTVPRVELHDILIVE
jgi:hypothetical protein